MASTTNTPINTHTGPAFLGLPAEIRIIIYEQLLADLLPNSPRNHHRRFKRFDCIGLYLSCRQVQAEFLDVLFKGLKAKLEACTGSFSFELDIKNLHISNSVKLVIQFPRSPPAPPSNMVRSMDLQAKALFKTLTGTMGRMARLDIRLEGHNENEKIFHQKLFDMSLTASGVCIEQVGPRSWRGYLRDIEE